MDVSHSRAVDLARAGDLKGADPWFLNAIARNPGDLAVLRDFADCVVAAADAQSQLTGTDSARAQLGWLVSFLNERVAAVEPDDMEELLGLIEKVRTLRDTSALAGPPSSPAWITEGFALLLKEPHRLTVPAIEVRQSRKGKKKDDSPLGRLLARAATDIGLNAVPRQGPDRLRWLAALQGLASAAGREDAASAVGEALSGHEMAAAADELAAAVEAELGRQEGLPLELRPYVLQTLDSKVRDLVGVSIDSTGDRVERARELVKRAEEAVEATRLERAKVDAQAAWSDVTKGHGRKIKEIERWKKPKSTMPLRTCQKRLDALQEIASAVSNATRGIDRHLLPGEATAFLAKLDERFADWSRAQHDLYNLWATERIRTALRRGKAHRGKVGLTADEEELAAILVEDLGPVDRGLLRVEVDRAYAEVFEYLFERLDKVKGADDFDNPKTKLSTLQRLAECERHDLTKF